MLNLRNYCNHPAVISARNLDVGIMDWLALVYQLIKIVFALVDLRSVLSQVPLLFFFVIEVGQNDEVCCNL